MWLHFRYPGVVRRTLLLGASAILALAGALSAILWHLSSPGPPQSLEPMAPLPAVAEPSTTPPPPAATATRDAPVPTGAAPAARPLARQGKAPGELFSGLGILGARAAACAARSAPAGARSRPEVLVLDIEPLAGEVRIVGVSPMQGTETNDALVRCARSEIVGREIPLAASRPGPTYKMSYSVRY